MLSKLFTLAALAAAVVAQTANFDAIVSPPEFSTLQAGTTFDIKWEVAPGHPEWDGPISITLLAGESPSTLVSKQVLAASFDQTKQAFAWAIDPSLGAEKTYGIEIQLVSNPAILQFSFPFAIKPSAHVGGSTTASDTTESATSATAHASASSSASVSVSVSVTTYPHHTKTHSNVPWSTVNVSSQEPATITSVVVAQPTVTPPVVTQPPTQVSGARALVAGSALVALAALFAL